MLFECRICRAESHYPCEEHEITYMVFRWDTIENFVSNFLKAVLRLEELLLCSDQWISRQYPLVITFGQNEGRGSEQFTPDTLPPSPIFWNKQARAGGGYLEPFLKPAKKVSASQKRSGRIWNVFSL